MKKYCIDTSGLSNPLETMPEDIFSSLWSTIYGLIESGSFAATTEIYDELELLPGDLGKTLKANKGNIVLEIKDDSWNWKKYIENSNKINEQHKQFISEYTGGSPKTVGLNDMTIICLAKTLQIPVVSMESQATNSVSKKRIPDICKLVHVKHMTFNDLLRAEGITL